MPFPYKSTNSDKRPCPVCGATAMEHYTDEYLDLGKVNDFTYSSRKQPEFMCWRLVRCVSCDLVYAPTPPDSNFLSIAYKNAAYDSGEEAECAARSYARALGRHCQRLTKRNAAVDVGAGSGALLPWLSKSGFNPVVGIEPSRAAINAARADIRPLMREGMFSPEMLSDVRPSLICSFMTLEHLAAPDMFVKTAYDMLEPGGMLAVVVHNRQGLLNRILGFHSPIIDVEHLQLYNPKSVEELLKSAGFEKIEVEAISNSYPLRYWLRLSPIPPRWKNSMGKIIECLSLGKIRIPFRVGNILAVGTKPA